MPVEKSRRAGRPRKSSSVPVFEEPRSNVRQAAPPRRYNFPFEPSVPDWLVELKCFEWGWTLADGGLGKYEHLKRAAETLYPATTIDPWLERKWRAFCEEERVWKSGDTTVRVISLVGVASSGKTFSAGRFAFLWWLANPANSIAILTSTSKINVGQRIWPVVQASYSEARTRIAALSKVRESAVDIGNLLASQKIIQFAKGDEKHAIFAQAVKDGETAKAEAFIRGQHAQRIFVSIDEAGETPPAIFSAVANLRKACQDLTIVISDNPGSRLNPHGRSCMPRGGWGHKPLHGNEWITEGVPEWQIESGLCLQFKGSESPNVAAGRTLYPYIYTWEDYQASQRPEIKNTLQYWRYDAGDWAPEGTANTVFNEIMAMNLGVQDGCYFVSEPEPVSFLDPGFGGDACIQVMGLLGLEETGELESSSPGLPARRATRQVLLIKETLDLVLDESARDSASRPEDFEHQIARQVIANCARFKVKPRNFGLFSTGTGRGVASILGTDWSNEILKVEEGGKASELPVSEVDRRPACDVYDRKVTELWFSARAFAEGRMLRGVPTPTLIQLCAREYETKGKPWRYVLETKEDFKPKLGRSCDEADATVGAVELVRVRHGARGGAPEAPASASAWTEQLKRIEAAAEPAYTAEAARELLADESELVGASDWEAGVESV